MAWASRRISVAHMDRVSASFVIFDIVMSL
jgi:hypothetical protein